jgi:hypothetical protein
LAEISTVATSRSGVEVSHRDSETIGWHRPSVPATRACRSSRRLIGYGDGVSAIDHEVLIERPAGEVWAVLEDVRLLPELSESTIAVHDAPERLTEVGQTFRQEVALLGRRFTSDWVVTALDPGRCLAIEGDVGFGVRYCLTERVEPVDARRCRFSLAIRYRLPLGAMGRLAGRLGVERRADREARAVAEQLRVRLERDPA